MLARGAEIKGFRIERLLGRGGMGEVYEATQLGLDRRVAFKVLHADLGRDEAFRQRFRREGRLQATLEHPNIVTVYEAGELDDGLFLAMRLVDGVTLKQLIASGELEAGRALTILAPAADALDTAHRAGLVHRDVKPQNILVGEGDRPFLADFGLTRGADHSALTRSGDVVGTIDYIAPEQVRGEPAGPASDVYAFSGVLYECLTGSVPYARPSDAAVLYAHISDAPPAVSSVRGDLPAGLDEVLARGMAKEPDERPESAAELVAAAAARMAGTDALDRGPRHVGPVARGVRPVGGETAGLAAEETPRTGRLADGGGGRRRLRARTLVPAGLGLLALGALAFGGGRVAGGKSEEALATSVANGAASLDAPTSWGPTSASERPAIPGLRLRQSIGAAPTSRDASGVSLGITSAHNARLLPAGFVGRMGDGRSRAEPVELGSLEALRYADVRVTGFDRDLTVFAAPTTAGVLTLACYSPATTGISATCDSIARSVELLRGRAYPLAPSPRTERGLERAIAGLKRERRTGRRRLSQAGSAERQAVTAHSLSGTYRHTARELGRLTTSPTLAGAGAAARGALVATARGYDELADGAASDDETGFDAAKRAIRQGEADLDRALRALERASSPGGDG